LPIDPTSLSPKELAVTTADLARKKRMFDTDRAIQRSRELIEASRLLIEQGKTRKHLPRR